MRGTRQRSIPTPRITPGSPKGANGEHDGRENYEPSKENGGTALEFDAEKAPAELPLDRPDAGHENRGEENGGGCPDKARPMLRQHERGRPGV
jgi:hypothetical protein